MNALTNAIAAGALTLWRAITTRGPVVWFRNLFYIVSNYRDDLSFVVNGMDACVARTQTVERYVKKATKVHIDLAVVEGNYTKVIVIGTYRGKDHVQIFSLRPGSIDGLIDQLRDMQRYAEIERIDGPMEIVATMKRELII